MRPRILLTICMFFAAIAARAQTQSVLTGTQCSNSCFFVNADPNLGGSPALNGCTFVDPAPIGATIRSVKIERKMSQAFAGYNPADVTVDLNSQTVGSTTVNTVAGCGGLVVYSFTSADYFLGFPGYVAGGTNTLFFHIVNGAANIGLAQVTVTYDTDIKSLTTTPGAPDIPANSGLVNDCLQFRSKLDVSATKGSAGVAGVATTIFSTRNATLGVDLITEPGVTDSTGHATGYLQTRLLGTVLLVTTAASFPSASTTLVVQEANFESPFLITAYYAPSEADYNGKSMTNPCGVTGTFKAAFLKAVKLESTGIAVDGRYIAYDGGDCYRVDTCVRTSSQTCATLDRTVAVDLNVMEYTTSMNITPTVGSRTAEDIGGAILGYHIDNFVGTKTEYKKWHNIKNATVRYLGGGGQCSN